MAFIYFIGYFYYFITCLDCTKFKLTYFWMSLSYKDFLISTWQDPVGCLSENGPIYRLENYYLTLFKNFWSYSLIKFLFSWFIYSFCLSFRLSHLSKQILSLLYPETILFFLAFYSDFCFIVVLQNDLFSTFLILMISCLSAFFHIFWE
jgi:hypothetical protein